MEVDTKGAGMAAQPIPPLVSSGERGESSRTGGVPGTEGWMRICPSVS